MSTCPDSDLWSALIDGEVPSPWKEKLEKHLASCADCRKRMDRYRNVDRIISANAPEMTAERLEASYDRLYARRAQVLAARQKGGSIAATVEWTRSSVRFSVPAFAAVLAAAIFLPTLVVLATVARIQPQTAQYVAILPATQNGAVDIDTNVKSLSTSMQVYSPDLPTPVVSKGLFTQKQLFKVVNFARQFTSDKTLFSNSDIVVIKLPEFTRFGNTGDSLIPSVNTLQTNAGFMR